MTARRPLPAPSNLRYPPFGTRELPDRTEPRVRPLRALGFRERVRMALRWHW